MNKLTHHDPKEALEYMLAHGAIRYTESGAVTHLPCSLVPWEAPGDFVAETEALTALYNDLYHKVGHDDDFLHTELERARAADDFVERLFQAKSHEQPGKPSLYLNRNDCMPAVQTDGSVWPKQVEMNLMASALGEASQVVSRMHRFLGQHQNVNLKENLSGSGLAKGLADGYREMNADGIILFLIPVGEVSVFDQRILESRLVEEYGLKTLKCSLQELGSDGELRGGDLYFRGHKVSIAYFRTGYAPRHYPAEESWVARNLIEQSSAVSVPSARTQLANTKLIQLVLSQEDVLKRFVNAEEAKRIARSCVAFTKLDKEFTGYDGLTALGREHGLRNPSDWVLKPHREGGGNNFFGSDIVEQLQQMSEAASEAYILMEMIRQSVFDSVRLVEGEAIPCRCVTELGFFGRAFYARSDAQATFNVADGYLLRTKDESMDEGLVLGGFSFLDVVKVG
jgi:glutathione synthetase